jgi:hypothetical protein
MTAEVAALPDAKATQNFAFSAAATALSNAPLVGLPLHDAKKEKLYQNKQSRIRKNLVGDSRARILVTHTKAVGVVFGSSQARCRLLKRCRKTDGDHHGSGWVFLAGIAVVPVISNVQVRRALATIRILQWVGKDVRQQSAVNRLARKLTFRAHLHSGLRA